MDANAMLNPYIIDEDLELRPLEQRHAPAMFGIVDRDRDYLRQYQNWPDKIRSLNDMRRSIRYSMQKRKQNSGMDFAVLFQGVTVGKIGLVYINWQEQLCEIGYWLAQRYQGQGIITRATRVMTGYALGQLHLQTVQIRCAVGNLRSRAIPERLDFEFDGIKPGMTQLHGEFVDDAVYAMTASRWYRRMIYHITSLAEWALAEKRGLYRAPSLESQGFIHFSQIHQVVPVADAFYRQQNGLVLLCVDPARLDVPLKFEPPALNAPDAHADEDLFPHVYGPVDTQAVIRVFDFPANGDGCFSLPRELPR
jgi:ribosomal-protein-serine acetyltransferase